MCCVGAESGNNAVCIHRNSIAKMKASILVAAETNNDRELT